MSLVFNILLLLISFTQLLISVQSERDIKPSIPGNLDQRCEWLKTLSGEDERLYVKLLICEDDNLTPEHRACLRKVLGYESQGRSVADAIKNACSPPEPWKHLAVSTCISQIGGNVNAQLVSRVRECYHDTRGSNGRPSKPTSRPGKPASGGSNRVPSGPEASRSNQVLVSAITTVLIVFIGGIVVGISH